ncbi:hypothetical protein KKH03_04100 [Patescibacteria group bacterium]|nr:hypothetical protein [Patescibacteria group bacterium]
MPNTPQTSEILGQNPDPAKLLQNLEALDTDQKKFNLLRNIFVEEADVNEYIQYLDTDEDIDLTRRQLTGLKSTLEGFKVYLKQYLQQTGERIGRFDERLAEGVKSFANPEATPEELEGIGKTRRRVAQAMQIANIPRGAKGKSLREVTQKGPVSGIESSKEQAGLLKNLEAQYPTMQATFERYEIFTKGMPTWEQVKKGLTPEVLDKALKLAEPTLLLIPPTTRLSKVVAINKHPAKGQKFDTYTHELENNDLWNGGKSKTENKWQVSIVEGIQNVAQDEQIYNGERNNYEMSRLWVKKYEDRGLDVMNDAGAYLTLMMKGLVEGKPIDSQTFTALNGKNLTETSFVAVGVWSDVQVRLTGDYPDSVGDSLRLRGSVGVDVPETT